MSEDMSPYFSANDELLIMKLACMSCTMMPTMCQILVMNPMTHLNLKTRFIVLFTLFYGHVPYAVTVSAAVATRSPADCSSMEMPYQPKHSTSK